MHANPWLLRWLCQAHFVKVSMCRRVSSKWTRQKVANNSTSIDVKVINRKFSFCSSFLQPETFKENRFDAASWAIFSIIRWPEWFQNFNVGQKCGSSDFKAASDQTTPQEMKNRWKSKFSGIHWPVSWLTKSFEYFWIGLLIATKRMLENTLRIHFHNKFSFCISWKTFFRLPLISYNFQPFWVTFSTICKLNTWNLN